eukprot:TRINITY_DN304_c0_g1_i5.p2 TRINITY_DN304_c0_g1~~TRINITY_DN304_c0_g1_i5.p2  ORF type:complete len:610 (-),score=120.31 TRINITY_DN304_c0_g1_i5:36-1865(-)
MKVFLIFLAILAVASAKPYHLDIEVSSDSDFVAFMKGFLEGINEHGDINKLMKCIRSGEQIMNKIKTALEYIAKKDIGSIITGVTMLIDAVRQLLDVMTPCMEGFNQLKRLVNAISHADIKKIAMKILLHLTEFISEVVSAIGCFQSGDFHCAGKNVGTILRKLFLDRALEQENPAIDFIKGFLIGIHEKKSVDDLLKCVKNMDEIFAKIRTALEYIMKLTFNDVVKGLQILMDAMKDFEKMLEPCLEGFNQLKKLMEAIKNWDLIKLAWKIIRNAGAFIHDINDCIESLKNQKFLEAGKDVGDILYRLFLSRAANESENSLIEFLSGFLIGIHETRTIDDLIKCMKNADQILEKIVAALKLILKLRIDDILRGFSMLFEAFLDLEMMLKPCLKEFTKFQRLMKEIANANLLEIIARLMRNPGPFIQDINDIVESFERGDYKQAGQDVGDILYRLFLVELVQSNKVMDFLEGFLEGLNEKGDINNLLKCVKNAEHILDKIMEALEHIKKKDPSNLIKGITMLLEAVTELLNILKPCSDGFEQIKKLFEAIQHIDIVKLVFKILANPGPYIQDVMDCIDSFKRGDFHRAGKDLGDFLYRLFVKEYHWLLY